MWQRYEGELRLSSQVRFEAVGKRRENFLQQFSTRGNSDTGSHLETFGHLLFVLGLGEGRLFDLLCFLVFVFFLRQYLVQPWLPLNS